MGDFNINLLNAETCNLTKEFLLTLQSYSFIPTIDKPTRVLVNKHALLKPLSNRKFKQSLKPWITKGLLKSIKIKNALFASGDIDKYKFYRNKIITLIQQSKKLYYHTYFTQHMNDMKKTWTGINEIMNRSKRKSKPIVCLKRLNGNGVTRNPAELLNVLNDFFSTVGQKLAANVPDSNCHYRAFSLT